jgi:hypothetical protein
MKKHFYNHIITTDVFRVALDNLSLSVEEKEELLSIAEKSIHHTILDVVLTELSGEDKKTFLLHVVAGNHDRVWQLLAAKMPMAEAKIKAAVAVLVQKMHNDIAEAKEK